MYRIMSMSSDLDQYAACWVSELVVVLLCQFHPDWGSEAKCAAAWHQYAVRSDTTCSKSSLIIIDIDH